MVENPRFIVEPAGHAPSDPPSKRELIEATKRHYDGIGRVIGKRAARRAQKAHVDYLAKSAVNVPEEDRPSLVRVTRREEKTTRV